MPCPRCGFESPTGMKFCGQCGERLPVVCPRCDFESPPGFRFCGGCGSALEGSAPGGPAAPTRPPRDYTPRHLAERILHAKAALEGERKHVTVLFADVRDSLELAGALGPEAWHELLDRFFERLADGVHRFEGTINQYTGDGIMALFGAPLSHEDHAQRACFAALHLRGELRAFAQEVKRRHGVDFGVRMGVNSGEVVVGKIGDDLRMDYTAQGHAVGLAQRMEALASAGSIYLGPATAELVRGYVELEDLGEFSLKGLSEPVRAYELIGTGGVRTRFDVSRQRGLVRFVGRDPEMQVLEDALEQARAGNGPVVGVVAQAGTGKSRLCYEFVERCRARGLDVNEGRCVAHGRNLPFLPVLEVVRGYYGIAPQDDARSAREKVAGRMLLLDEAYREELPLIFEFMGIADPEHPAPPLPPEARQRRLFGVLRSITRTGGGPGGEAAVVLIEDLHWLDGGSAAWVAEWVDATADSHTLLLLNFRPEYHAAWMQRAHYRQIALAPLSADALRELVVELIGRDPSTAALADRIHAHTAGNPFFAEEVVRSLVESGQLAGERGAYRLTAPVERLEVPASVQAVLAARIDRLAEREKQVLQAAAVIGKDFALPVLSAVASLPERDLDEAIARLRQNEFVHELSLYPVARYSFKHPLTQAVALDSLLGARRAALHAAVARALEATSPDLDEDAALLAHHWDAAGERITGAEWHLRAADWIGAKDVRETALHARAVLDGLRQSDDPRAPALLALAAARLMNLGWRLGMDDAEAERLYADGSGWARSAGRMDVLAQLAAGHGAVLALKGEITRCLERADRFLEFALQSGDEEMRALERGWMTYPRLIQGRLAECEERLADAMAACERDPGLGAGFLGASLMGLLFGWLVEIRLRTRPLGESQALLERGLRWVRARGEVESESFLLSAFTGLAHFGGDVARALPLARQALARAEDLASPVMQVSARRALADCLLAGGEAAAALELLDERAEMTHRLGIDLQFEPSALASRARAQCALGRLDEALATARLAVADAERMGSGLQLPYACEALAIAHLTRGEIEDATAAIDRMAASAEAIGAVNILPRAHRLRAQLADRRGDAAARQRWLVEARAGFLAMGATVLAEQLDARA